MGERVSGILPVHKLTGMTSHDVVDQVRKVIGQKAVGHVGTLDPAAEGLLILCLGQATKLARYLSGQTKVYRAVIALGRTSTTWDAEGVDLSVPNQPLPSLDSANLEKVLDNFRGQIEQRVPIFSAVRQGGERLYRKARRNEEVETPIREVTIHRLTLISHESDSLRIEVDCSSGTYIRSLAHEIGQALGCGGYLAELLRTSIGRIALERACSLTDLQELFSSERLSDKFITVDEALGFSTVVVNNSFTDRVRNGQQPTGRDLTEIAGSFTAGDEIMVKDGAGQLLAIARATLNSDELSRTQSESMLAYERVLA